MFSSCFSLWGSSRYQSATTILRRTISVHIDDSPLKSIASNQTLNFTDFFFGQIWCVYIHIMWILFVENETTLFLSVAGITRRWRWEESSGPRSFLGSLELSFTTTSWSFSFVFVVFVWLNAKYCTVYVYRVENLHALSMWCLRLRLLWVVILFV